MREGQGRGHMISHVKKVSQGAFFWSQSGQETPKRALRGASVSLLRWVKRALRLSMALGMLYKHRLNRRALMSLLVRSL